jgi:hypothetical protein
MSNQSQSSRLPGFLACRPLMHAVRQAGASVPAGPSQPQSGK